ncbi:Zinc finger C2HC domain-containing protein 1A [Anthophora retusa]
MLCCVSRRAVAEVEQEPPYDHFLSKEQPVVLAKTLQIEQSPEPDVPPILLPCAICARTFMPQSLEKHVKICERSANKRRKPFDSAKQRIQGTELAEFLPRQEKKRHSPDNRFSKSRSTWKQTHDDFLRAIRAARNEVVETTVQRCGGTTVTPNAPTRANEQGTCPTCNRHFGVKAYDRHVAWCKERITRVTISPATNIAKERLEARMKYRAPSVKNRRQMTREKYSPGSAITLTSGNKTSPTLVPVKPKESVSAPNCNKSTESPVKQKPTVVRRSGQTKESSNHTVSAKLRPIERANRLLEDEAGPVTFRPAFPSKRTSYLPVPPLKSKKESLEELNNISPRLYRKQPRRTDTKVKRDETVIQKLKQDEKHQSLHSARSLKANIVSARSQGNPKINDVSINDETVGVIVRPCNIYKESQLITWKEICHGKDSSGSIGKSVEVPNLSTNMSFSNLNDQHVDTYLYEKQLENIEFALTEESLKREASKLSSRSESSYPASNCEDNNHLQRWMTTVPTLNRTYSFRDPAMNSKEKDVVVTGDKKWKSPKHSSRMKSSLIDPEEINHARASTIGSDCSEKIDVSSNFGNYTNLQDDCIRQEISKHFVGDSESVLTSIRSEEENFNLETPETKLPSQGSLKSSRSRTSERKRSSSTIYENYHLRNSYKNDVQNSCNYFELTNSKDDISEKNNTASDVLNNDVSTIEKRSSLDRVNQEDAYKNENLDTVLESANENLVHLSKENLQPSTSCKQYPYLDEFHTFSEALDPDTSQNVDEEMNLSAVHYDRSSSRRTKTIETNDIKNDNDEHNININNLIQPLKNEHEYSTKNESTNDMTFYDETNWIDMDADLVNGMLQPTRSSTPFTILEECINRKCDIYKNIEEESCPTVENYEWKTEIDTKTGSEMLRRVEGRDSTPLSAKLSSRSKIHPLKKTNSDNETLQFRNRSNSKHSEFNKNIESISRNTSSETPKKKESFLNILPIIIRKDENLSRIASPTVQKGTKFPKIHKKEIASQINMCKCSDEVSSMSKCDKGVGDARINSTENTVHIEPEICNTFPNDVNVKQYDVKEQHLEAHGVNNVNETSCNSKRDEFSQCQFNTDLPKDNHNYTKCSTTVKDNNDLRNTTKTFEESASKIDTEVEEVQQLYKNSSCKDFEYDSDNSIEHHIKDAINNLKCPSIKNDIIAQNLRSVVLSTESRVKLSQRVRVDESARTQSTAFKSHRSKAFELQNVWNESSDSFGSSVDVTNFANSKQVETVEVETIEEIGTRNRSIRFRILPEIKGTATVVKETCDEKEKIDTQTYWEKASQASRNRLINFDPPYHKTNKLYKRNPKVHILPPVPSNTSLITQRVNLYNSATKCSFVHSKSIYPTVLLGYEKLHILSVYTVYVVLGNISGKDYDPFLLAEQQMNELLSDTSEQSVTDSPTIEKNGDTAFPLSHSSAFVKYPCQSSLSSPEKRSSLIAPPSEFDDLTSDFSSDSTETNSLSREVFLKELKDSKEFKDSISKSDVERNSPKELGRRVIIDKSKALGGEMIDDTSRGSRSFVASSERARKILEKVSPKVVRPTVNRSASVRASSAPKTTMPDRKTSKNSHEKRLLHKEKDTQRSSNSSLNSRNNNYTNLSGSNLSLSSIMSSDVDIKRSNSVFDDLMTSLEDENGSFPSLKSLLKSDSLSVSSPVRSRQRNGQISDGELSSPESYKRQDHHKMSGDSAYSSTNDVAGRFDEELPRTNRRDGDGIATMSKCKMSKYCHECGSKFPETAKFCCECGNRRLVL